MHRRLLLARHGRAVSEPALQPGPVMYFGANIGQTDYDPVMYRDVVRASRGFGAAGENGENLSIARDANGWPLNACRLVLTAGASHNSEWETGVFKCRYVDRDGVTTMTETLGNATVTNKVRTGNAVTFDLTVSSSPTVILEWSGGISDLQVMHPGALLDTPQQLLRPVALEYYKQFHTLRMLDFMDMNNGHELVEQTWAARQTPGKYHGRKSWEAAYATFAEIYAAPGSRTRGVWICVPWAFSEADCLAMAQHAKALLPAGARKWVEYANELWNSVYVYRDQLFAIANDTGHPDYGQLNTPATTDPWTRFKRAWALRVARMARAWQQAFPGEFGSTLMPVYAGQHFGIHWITDGLAWLALAPQVAEFGAVGSYVGALSSAIYPQGEVAEMDAPTTSAQMLADLQSGFTYSAVAHRTGMDAMEALRASHGIAELVAYETNWHMHNQTNIAVKLATHLDPAGEPILAAMWRDMRARGYSLACALRGNPESHLADNVNTHWGYAQGFLPTAATPKLMAAKQLITESGL